MVSDFRKKKLLHVFNAFFDTDGSGYIDQKDFEEAMERINKARGWGPGDEKYKYVKDTLLDIWKGIMSTADSDNDGKVTQEEWFSMWESFKTTPAEWQNDYCKFAFSIEDASNDGAISSEEFATVFTAFGLDKDEAVTAFQKMAKGKSEVTWAEFQELWKEYFVSEDVNAAGNFIFGKTSF